MSSVLPTDKVLVQRATTLHSAPADMSTVQDTDLLLINRAGVDYKCSVADWKASQVGVNKPSITTPAAGAVDLGETPTFTSSAFSATGAVTHASSDWQVTLKTDTAFASPVVQSMADTTNLVSWQGGPLQPNTDYIARVRHNGSGGLQSPWSDAVGFKTKAAFILAMQPGLLYRVVPDTNRFSPITAPVLFTNVATVGYSSPYGIAVGVDGKVYTCASPSAAMAAEDPTWSGITAASVAGCDISTLSTNTSSNALVLDVNGDAYFNNKTNKCPEKCSAVGGFGMYNRIVWAVSEANKLYAVSSSSYTCIGVTVSTHWTEIPLPGIPVSSAKIKQVASYSGNFYNAHGLVVLLDDGSLWKIHDPAFTPTIPGLSQATERITPAVRFKMIATAGGTYRANQGVSALAENGDVYWASQHHSVSWGVYAPLGKCRSPIFGGYAANNMFVLKDDGLVYSTVGNSKNFNKMDYVGSGLTEKPVTSLGSVPFSMTSDGSPAYLILHS